MQILRDDSMPLPRYLFFVEGQKRGYNGKRWMSDNDKIYTSFEKDGFGFTMETIPFMHSVEEKYQDIGKLKKVKSDMMLLAEMPVPKQWGPYYGTDVFKNDLEKIPFPIVIKPNHSTFSRGAHTGISSKESAVSIMTDLLRDYKDGVVVEQQIIGDEYRIVFVEQEFVACTKRERAHVIGDGIHTIEQLIDIRNQEPVRGSLDSKKFTNHPLVITEKTLELLKSDDYSLNTVLPSGEKFVITDKITGASGVDYVDYTNAINPDYIAQCLNFMKKYDIFLVGFDLITPDITKSPLHVDAAYNEFNISPFIDLNENCNVGDKQPVSKIMWDHLEVKSDIFTENLNLI